MCVRCWHAYLQNEALVDRELACNVMQRFDNWLYTKTPRLSMCFVHLAVLGAQQVAALYRAHTSCLQREQLNRIIIISCFLRLLITGKHPSEQRKTYYFSRACHALPLWQIYTYAKPAMLPNEPARTICPHFP